MHHCVASNFGSAKMCSPAMFETCFSYDKDILIAATDYYMHFYISCAISIDSYSHVIKFHSFIIFTLLVSAVILLLNGIQCYFLMYIT